MSKPPDTIVDLSETLSLCWYPPTSGHHGFWLYDETRGMNLAMRAKSEQDAFVEALTYYQERLKELETELHSLQTKVNAFVGQFADDSDYEPL